MSSPNNHGDLAHLKIPLEEILAATNNFDDKNLIREDASGKYYKAQLLWSGELIDILAFRFIGEWDDEEEQEFWMYVSMLSSLKHKNLISLVGFCDENDEMIIIIKNDFTRHLTEYLSESLLLTWVQRLEICVGLAHALSYIYYDESRDFSIIHGNIGSDSVMLNDDWEPKLECDFTLSIKIKASERHRSFNTDKVIKDGDRDGYTDPTYIETNTLNHKSDVYSFGVVMLELLCGRLAVIEDGDNKFLAPLAITHYREKKLNEIIDWDLLKQIDSQSFIVFTKIAYDCLNEERSQRPNVDEIVKRLEKALELQLEQQKAIMSSPSNEFAPLKHPLQNIISATNNFDEENHIITSAFAKEYKGQVLWSGELIDISAQRFNKERNDLEQMFWTEISMLSSLKHKNLVSLVGYCDENDEKIIIIRRETRGMLDRYLSDLMSLTWVRRLKICLGVAHALSYIHYDEPRDFSVIHRHIDSSRVVLNEEWEPKLCDFGCSMKIKASQRHHSFHTNQVQYVKGYGDPTYIETKRVSHKSDMYSFGILLFELLCGRKTIIDNNDDNHLAPLAITHYREKRLHEIIDWDLWKHMDSQSFNIFAKTAYDCLDEERPQRPNMDVIVTRLEKALEHQLEHQKAIMSWRMDNLAHLNIPLESILSATNNFDVKNVIWNTGYDKRYQGQLSWDRDLIAVTARRFNKDRDEMFWTEVLMLSSLKHQNLDSLVGFCDENGEKVIITRGKIKGSLCKYLGNCMLLTWVQRLKISVGLAHALRYIHYDEPRDFSVIHGHISSSTVLLDDNLEPKLASFEKSTKIEATQRHHSFHTSKVCSMNGYTDPTYAKTKSVNHKTDMYYFKIVLFELMCGRQSIIANDTDKSLAILLYKEKRLNEIVDWDLWKQMDSQSFDIFAEIAYDCLNDELSQRSNIDEIVSRLEQALELAREKHIMSLLKDDLAHLKIPLENVLSATNNFDEENIINSWGYCKEYKGKLFWSGDLIDIWARRLGKERDANDEQQFWMEVSLLSSLKHNNLVSLVGFCDENGEKIIINRLEIRGCVRNYLSDPMLITWVRRLEICVGIANALSYIHYDKSHDFSVMHRSISSAMVILNYDWEPKLSYFDISMKIKASQRHHSFHTNRPRFVSGYADPTYGATMRMSHKSDMYSFGVVLFELLCGRASIIDNTYDHNLVPLAITQYQENKLENIIDKDLWKQIDLHSFNMFAEIAYECLDDERSRRPNIDEIVPRLEKALELARENRPIHSAPSHLDHLRISCEDIEFATNYFDFKNAIGTGGFGKRYKGQLFWSGELIDITAERLINIEWDDEIEQQFWMEISILSSLKHNNVVSIVGFCNEVGVETIIYKGESRRRLDYYLSEPKLLTWVKRLEICVGIAHAISYIHHDEPRDFSIIHWNISSETVQLNNDWEPKLSEFQHSVKTKVSERHHVFHTDSVWSKKGYTDPTYLETKTVNHKADIYSLGIVLFELLCGRKSVSEDQDNKYLAPVAVGFIPYNPGY